MNTTTVNNPLCFTAKEAGSSVWMYNNEGNAPTIYYSLGSADNWTLWDYNTITLSEIGDKVYFYGENEYIAHDIVIGWSSPYSAFKTSGKIAASGDVTTLLDPEGVDVLTADFCFAFLFDHSECLFEAPELPSTTLSEGCYYAMFSDCENLEKAPYLPATNLATDCYKNIFAGCTSLVDVSFNSEAEITETEAENWLVGVSEYGLIYGADSTYDVIYGIPSNWVGMAERKAFNYKELGDSYVFSINTEIYSRFYWNILGYLYCDEDEDSEVTIYVRYNTTLSFDDDDWNNEYGVIDHSFTQLGGTQLWISFDMERGYDIIIDHSSLFNNKINQPTINAVENTVVCHDGTVVKDGTATVTVTPNPEIARNPILHCSVDDSEYFEYTNPFQITTGTHEIKTYASKEYFDDSDVVTMQVTVIEEECPTDCTDCNNWEECGYESYDDCRCQQYGECPEPPEPERTRIVETIRNILTGMADDESCELQSWQYNDMATSNVKLDNKKPSPTAVFYQVTDFEYDLRTGIRREKANILVAFLQKENKLDAEGLEQDIIIKQMSDIAFEFLSKIMAEGSLRILNDKIKLKSTFLRSDSNRTGVVIELELEEKSGTCLQ